MSAKNERFRKVKSNRSLDSVHETAVHSSDPNARHKRRSTRESCSLSLLDGVAGGRQTFTPLFDANKHLTDESLQSALASNATRYASEAPDVQGATSYYRPSPYVQQGALGTLVGSMAQSDNGVHIVGTYYGENGSQLWFNQRFNGPPSHFDDTPAAIPLPTPSTDSTPALPTQIRIPIDWTMAAEGDRSGGQLIGSLGTRQQLNKATGEMDERLNFSGTFEPAGGGPPMNVVKQYWGSENLGGELPFQPPTIQQVNEAAVLVAEDALLEAEETGGSGDGGENAKWLSEARTNYAQAVENANLYPSNLGFSAANPDPRIYGENIEGVLTADGDAAQETGDVGDRDENPVLPSIAGTE